MRVAEILRRMGWFKEKRYLDSLTGRKVRRWRPIEDPPRTHLGSDVGPESNPSDDKAFNDLDPPDPPLSKSYSFPVSEPRESLANQDSDPMSDLRSIPQNSKQEEFPKNSQKVGPVGPGGSSKAEIYSLQGIQDSDDLDPPPQAGESKGGANQLISGKTRLRYVGQQYEVLPGSGTGLQGTEGQSHQLLPPRWQHHYLAAP